MNARSKTLRIALVCALSSSAFAVTPQRGMHSALALGLSFHDGSSLPRDTMMKAPGDQASPPVAYDPGSFPMDAVDYSLAAMFPGLTEVSVDIDAHSSGNDRIPTGTGGLPDLTDRWMAVTVSVANTAQGLPNGQIRAVKNVRAPGADLFSYYMEGSTGIHSSLPGNEFIEQTRRAVGLSGSAVETEDIDALDYGIGVNSFGRGSTSLLFFPEKTRYYFSVTADSAIAINDHFKTNPGEFAVNNVKAHAATIYMIQWANDAWSQPEVYRTWSQLGLSSGEDLDGLALDKTSNIVVFSTVPDPVIGRSQLLLNYENDSTPYTFMSKGANNGPNVKVTERLGGIDDTDDIDGIGISDPEPELVGTHLGIAFDSALVFQPMGLSVTRERQEFVEDENLLIQLTGWGNTVPQPGFAVLCMAHTFDKHQPNNGWVAIEVKSRQVIDDEVEFELLLPSPSTSAALTVFYYDSTGTQIVGQSYASHLAFD